MLDPVYDFWRATQRLPRLHRSLEGADGISLDLYPFHYLLKQCLFGLALENPFLHVCPRSWAGNFAQGGIPIFYRRRGGGL